LTLREFDRLDPSERDYWVADWQVAQQECGHCGQPRSECSDPEKLWYPQRTICYPTRERAAANALYAQLHEDAQYHDGNHKHWSATRTRATPYRYDEGVSIWVAPEDLAPDDDFLGSPSA